MVSLHSEPWFLFHFQFSSPYYAHSEIDLQTATSRLQRKAFVGVLATGWPRPDTFRLTFGPCQLACTVTTLLNTLLQIYPLIVTFEKLLSHFLSSLGIVFKFCKFPISKLELLEISSLL